MPLFDHPVRTGTPNIGDRAHLHSLVDKILDRAWLTNNGPVIQELERRLAERLSVRHCIAVANGTVAIEVTARALSLTGEVILPSFTFVASAHALSWIGLEPVFCDIDERSYCIDPASIPELITGRTSAIMGVHVYGRPCDTAALDAISAQAGIPVIYDAAHALGCSHGGVMIGGFGACETFSFHATKFFNTFEGGAVTTNDDSLAHVLRRGRSFGYEDGSRLSGSLGTNAKMPEVAAAMGLVNLDLLDRIVERNRENHQAYCDVFESVPGLSMVMYDESEISNFQYAVVEVGAPYPHKADALKTRLEAENVFVQRYFAPPVHLQAPYAGRIADLPRTESLSQRVLALPTGLAVTPEDARRIASFIAGIA